MSYRCSICDFAPDMPSVYNEGLITSNRPFKNNISKKVKNEYVCDHCFEEIRTTNTWTERQKNGE